MTIYPVFYKTSTTAYVALTNRVYNTDTGLIEIIASPSPSPPTTTLRSFDLPLGQTTGKKPFGFRLGDMIVRGDGYITFFNDFVSMSGPAPRLYVYDEKRLKKWKNVEVIIEYMRVSESGSVPSYAGLGIGVRSIHEVPGTNVLPTLYLKHTFDGRFFFEKEAIHGQSYTKQTAVSLTHPKSVWQKVKFTVIGNTLKGYYWKDSAWALLRDYTDTGTWNGKPPIAEGTSCFIRTDAVTDFRIKTFSIRELAV
jgi:hypothetical protein